jgi:hypothetical protein
MVAPETQNVIRNFGKKFGQPEVPRV